MNKIIILSVRPEHAAKILNADKTLELRKSVPKNFVGWVYIYVTKGNGTLHRLMTYDDKEWFVGKNIPFGWVVDKRSNFNGEIVARFWFDQFREVMNTDLFSYSYEKSLEDNLAKACLTMEQLLDYMPKLPKRKQTKYLKYKWVYFWNIKELEVFNEPMKLSDFNIRDNTYDNSFGWAFEDDVEKDGNHYTEIKRAPQSWQFAYVKGEK